MKSPKDFPNFMKVSGNLSKHFTICFRKKDLSAPWFNMRVNSSEILGRTSSKRSVHLEMRKTSE